MTRLKLAELTSGVGALVLGVGLGALFPRWFGPAAGVITVRGLSLHAFGMWELARSGLPTDAVGSPGVIGGLAGAKLPLDTRVFGAGVAGPPFQVASSLRSHLPVPRHCLSLTFQALPL